MNILLLDLAALGAFIGLLAVVYWHGTHARHKTCRAAR
jgi:hypothetical protein